MTASSAHQVAAAEPVIRRVVAARADPADVDDLVQDCLERLLAARGRLSSEAVLPYAIVTARNVVTTHARNTARRATAAPRIADTRQPERPEDVLLAGEARRAMTAALAQLSPQERSDIFAYYHDDPLTGSDLAKAPGALRVRMSRTRAKLRLEYLLAFRHVELPTPVCRRVLLAISAGDTRRQREVNAGQHLLDCQTCAALSEPLGRRSIALTAMAVPAALAGRALAKARVHPVHAVASATAGSAAVAVAVVLATRPAPPVKPPGPVISRLAIAGSPVPDALARHSIRSMIGAPAAASGASVDAAVTRNGFWIGTAHGRVWVELTGPLRPLQIRAGDHVRFTGTVVANPASYPARAGVTGADGAGLLALQGAHLAVRTTQIKVDHTAGT